MLVCESQFDESKTLLQSNTDITISNDVGTYIIAISVIKILIFRI